MKKLSLILISFCIFIGCESVVEKSNSITNDDWTEIGELEKFADSLQEMNFPAWESYHGTIEPMEMFFGVYDIDTTKNNLHNHSQFSFELVRDSNELKMIFISCSDYSYSDSWKEQSLFGILDSLIDSEKNLFLAKINEHRGYNEFELTDHKLKFNKDEIVIYTGAYSDSYKRIE